LVVPGVPGVEQHPAWVTRFLRDRLLPPGRERVPGRCVYVTRGDSKNNRAVLNEREVIAALEAHEVACIDAGALTVDDQIRTFAEADVVISAHGAALTNIVFMSPGALVIELFPAAHVMACYWKLAGTVPGLHYRYLCGIGHRRQPDRTKMLVSDITVDIPALLSIVDEHRAGASV
jgi:capsular polysaccharide biosynthesis protein